MAHDVVISYAAENRLIADAICAILEGRRIRCWTGVRWIGHHRLDRRGHRLTRDRRIGRPLVVPKAHAEPEGFDAVFFLRPPAPYKVLLHAPDRFSIMPPACQEAQV